MAANERLAGAVLAVILGSAPLAATADEGSAPWREVHRGDGVVVLQRPSPGSSHHEFQATTVIDVPMARVLATLDDPESRQRLSAACKESREIDRTGLGKVVTYDLVEVPWPLADRDLLLAFDFHTEVEAGRVVIEFHEVTRPELPPRDGVIRVPLVRGQFTLRPRGGGGSTEVQYRVRYDPGGRIPVWLANAFNRTAPLRTLAGLRREAMRRPPGPLEARIAAREDYCALMAGLPPGE